MKRLFYASAAILMLSLAFHFGYTTARAQAPGNPVVATVGSTMSPIGTTQVVVTANGDVYYSTTGDSRNWTALTNVFSGGGPTPALHESWGQVKARYRTTPPATPGVTVAPGASDR